MRLGNLLVTDILEGFSDPAILLSGDYHILAANKAYRRRFRCADSLIGSVCYNVSHRYNQPCDQVGEACPLRECQSSGIPKSLLHLHHTSQGRIHEQVTTYPVHDTNGKMTCFVEILTQASHCDLEPIRHGLVGESAPFNQMLGLIARVAKTATPVLLLGESGPGKELAAQAIHQTSGCADGPFVPVECSGLSESLFESELFGHEKGAFTGAVGRKSGLVEAARGGTLFLDELGDIPPSLQVKLLRLLETGTYRRVGSTESQHANFRLICATHRDLKAQITTGQFRQDLYYRLSAFPIRMPPLRERTHDLPLLIRTLLGRLHPGRSLQIAPETLALLLTYPFPGNIRELRNILERATLLGDGSTLRPEDLPDEVRTNASSPISASDDSLFLRQIIPLEQMEHRYLCWALTVHHGDRRSLANALGLSERTLYRKLEACSIPNHR